MQESESVRAIVEALETGLDADTWIGRLGSGAGVLAIGSDSAEWWEGRDRIADIWRTQLEEMAGMKIRPTAPTGFEEGSVGWFADRPVMVLPDGTELGGRITGVVHREDDDWKIVQLHFSVGAANEDVIGTELTT